MRRIRIIEPTLDFAPMDARELERFEIMNEVLKKGDRVLDLVAADLLENVSDDCGREGMSAEQVLRFAIVKQQFGWSYETLYSRVHDSIALRRFCRCEFEVVPKGSTLHENIKKVRAETFEELNELLIRFAKREKIEDGRKVRVDTTAVETNIHYPTDSRLLEDGIRVLTRLLRRAREVFPGANIRFHDRTRVAKKRAFAIANAKTKSERVELYKELLAYAKEVLRYGRAGVLQLKRLEGSADVKEAARIVAKEIDAMVKLLAQVIDQTHRRVIKGEKVPADEKVVSLFEPHTDVIEKGGRETVFGHKICVTVGKKNLVLSCAIEEGNPNDTSFFQDALRHHRKQYGYYPTTVATDGGFASVENAEWAKSKGVEEVSFSKRVGAKLKALLVPEPVQRLLGRFRAGVEGIISALKRGVGLGRCLWSGWESFQSYVWSSIVAHNVKMLTAELLRRKRKAAQAT